MKKRLQARATTGALWIYNPWLDLIVGCGAWSAPLLLIAYLSITANTLTWSVAFYGLALFFNYPHYMATIYRAYHREADFNRYRIFTVHITFLVLLTAVLSHFWFSALPWIFTLYLTGSPWHYSGQNYGLFMMFARRAGAEPTRNQRHAIYSAFLLSYAILFLNFHTGPSADPLFISLNLPGRFSSALLIVLAVAFIGCSMYGLSSLIGQTGWRGMVPSLTLFATQFTWFLLPTVLSLGDGFHVPQSRYSTGVLAVMHSAQYLWITSYYARHEALAEGRSTWRPFAYFAILIAGGIALFIPAPWIASHVFHFDFTRSFLIFTALVNIHHFILDGAIWKLREGRIAALLVHSQVRATEAATQARSRVVEAFRWIASPAPRARALRFSLAAALLIWGSVDQIHYYFALRRDNLADLQRAARLASYDTPVQMQLAQKAIDANQTDEAVAAWKRAMASSPSDPAPRNAYLQYLTSKHRYHEAYEITRAASKNAPKDAQLLMNHGILALQLGHDQEALEAWKGAVANDPTLADARFYLGAELDRENKPGDALAQYEKYLELVAQQGPASRPPAAKIIGVALKLADCQLRTDQPDAALQSFELARKLAVQTGEKKLESFASVNQATLLARRNRADEAQQLFQRALFLDDSLHDLTSEAADLYSYATFLSEAKYPARLAYAVLLRADVLTQGAGGTAGPPTNDLRKNLERQLGSQAAALRKNSEPALAEALAPKS